jgi:hypothetical protein
MCTYLGWRLIRETLGRWDWQIKNQSIRSWLTRTVVFSSELSNFAASHTDRHNNVCPTLHDSHSSSLWRCVTGSAAASFKVCHLIANSSWHFCLANLSQNVNPFGTSVSFRKTSYLFCALPIYIYRRQIRRRNFLSAFNLGKCAETLLVANGGDFFPSFETTPVSLLRYQLN